MCENTPPPQLDVVYKMGGGGVSTGDNGTRKPWVDKTSNEGRGTVFSGTLMITSWPSEGK